MGITTIHTLLGTTRMALDANIFIYVLNDSPDFPLAVELFKKLPTYTGEVFTSVLTLLEITVPLYRLEEKQRIPDYLDFLYGNGKITVCPVEQSIALKAAELRAKYKLKTPDAIHLATAVIKKADIFITADQDFPKLTINTTKIVRI